MNIICVINVRRPIQAYFFRLAASGRYRRWSRRILPWPVQSAPPDSEKQDYFLYYYRHYYDLFT